MKSFQHIHDYSFLFLIIITGLLGVFLVVSCNQPKEEAKKHVAPDSQVIHPEWSRNANIYEVNIRQYTPEGTFNAFMQHLPRLKETGVDILWLMPIFPIGEKNRKGTLGSYYSIKDYKSVNPEFGTMEDFKALVKDAHDLGLKVILDWVANHSAWDNNWITEHPEWYTKDSLGKMTSPFDWSDVADLNFDEPGLRAEMLDAMKFWLTDTDIDGYRCDVAMMVPTEFWDQVRAELDKIKPVFMLAEAEQPDHHAKAFDMSYAWELHHIFNGIAKGEKNANAIETYFEKQDTLYPQDAYRMSFITNHDENSWNGTEYERMGTGANTFAVLSYLLPGMPLIYSGQENGFNRRLQFFEKDSISWDAGSPLNGFYKNLNQLKKSNPALWNGTAGGSFDRIITAHKKEVLAFLRQKEENKIFVISNLSNDSLSVKVKLKEGNDEFKEFFTGDLQSFSDSTRIQLNPWQYCIYVNK
ncbi:MAG: alpha-amylase [Bacteroidetes bacterium]|nr:alpha-amylase [Bacteroidota bacterium]